MKITWAGQACFQISVSGSPNRNATNVAGGKDNQVNIVIDPFGEIGLKIPNFEADILLLTHGHEDHNNAKAIRGSPFLINGPGEYEVKGVFVQGIDSFHDDSLGKDRGRNTIYTIEAEDMKFCHLGDLGQKQLTDEQLEKIGTVDILMIPVGGVYTIDSSDASKIIGQIEPKIVIPMHYELPGLKFKLDGVSKFLKSMGKNSIQPQDKLTIKTSTLPKDREMEIIVLKP
ncbi:MAG: MBL fold metallo-hydrolase [Patescibacteria group bacterium]